MTENCRRYSCDSFDGKSTNFNGLFILSFSIKSLNENDRKFTRYIDEFNKKPDIIMFSETWCNETIIDNIPGYKSILFCTHEKLGGGLSHFFVEMTYLLKL